VLIPNTTLDRAVAEFGTPVFLVDVGQIRDELSAFHQAFPATRAFYSTKTNPHPIVVDTVAALGMEFDAASTSEIAMLMDRGVAPDAIVFTHPRKTEAEIEYAASVGVTSFVFDSQEELTKLGVLAPAADLYLRLAVAQYESVYDYRGRFGAPASDARSILTTAVELGCRVAGLTFHVGTQTLSLRAWREATDMACALVDEFHERLPSLRCINVGCGIPFDYGRTGLITSSDVAQVIQARTQSCARPIDLAAEPGRPLIASAMTLVTRVEHIVLRAGRRWVSVDASVYQGLTEILQSGGRVRYEVTAAERQASASCAASTSACTVVGKTVDPDDILAEDAWLPADLHVGDMLLVSDVGAYSVPFIVDYHMLPRPAIVSVDSTDDDRVVLGPTKTTGWGVFARRAFATRERVMSVLGHRIEARSRFTVQVGAHAHVEPTVTARHLNHSCSPSAGIRTRPDGFLDVIAMRPIATGDEIVVDYAMFESEVAVASSVPCGCGAAACRGVIRGFNDLAAADRNAYEGYLASHLARSQCPSS